MHQLLTSLLTTIAAHPHGALAIVFVVAFLESVLLIGTLIPAAIIMFAAGALVGAGSLDLWTTLGAATLGAVLGDGLSYELGRTNSFRIRNWPVMKRFAGLMTRAEQFLGRHGGKSILFARFFGPMRATVPMVAGIACMPRVRFYPVNIGSAMLWAPAHVLPGVLFGASIRIAEAVTARLALLLLLLTGLLWFVVWLVRVAGAMLLPALRRQRDRALLWAAPRRSRPARALRYFFDPDRPESQVLLVMAALLIGGVWSFLIILDNVLDEDPLVDVDIAVYNFLQGVRTSTVDHAMLAVTELGGGGVLLPLLLLVLGWLLVRQCWHTAGYWLAAAGFSEIVGRLLLGVFARPRPGGYVVRPFDVYPFPSGHAISSMVIYGFLAFLLARGQATLWQKSVATIAALVIALIGFSRLYLGAHWFSDVAAGFSLGLAWVSLLAMVYIHHQVGEDTRPRQQAAIVLLALCVIGPWYVQAHFARDIALYAPRAAPQRMALAHWLAEGWQQVPVRRVGIGGEAEEALPLQWADEPAAISSHLIAAGWQPAPPWSARNALLWLTSEASPANLPVLPRYSRGRAARLAFIRVDPAQPMARTVLRLWRSRAMVHTDAGDIETPLWYGALYREEFRQPRQLATLWTTASVAPTPGMLEAWRPDRRWSMRNHGQDESAVQVFLLPPAGDF